MPEPVLIADSSPLIGLARIGRLSLLPKLAERVVVPQGVWDEVTISGKGAPGAAEVSRAKWIEIDTANPSIAAPLMILIDRGEAEVLALASVRPKSIVLMDDSRARRVAERLQIRRIGTVGLLRKAKIAGLVDRLRPLLESLQENGIYLHQDLVEAVLADVGE